jgi:hypothetical protein
MPAFSRFLPAVRGRNRPILLKKAAIFSTAQKYAPEIEVLTLSRGFRAQISRSCAQKGILSSQYEGGLEGPTFQHNLPIVDGDERQILGE